MFSQKEVFEKINEAFKSINALTDEQTSHYGFTKKQREDHDNDILRILPTTHVGALAMGNEEIRKFTKELFSLLSIENENPELISQMIIDENHKSFRMIGHEITSEILQEAMTMQCLAEKIIENY